MLIRLVERVLSIRKRSALPPVVSWIVLLAGPTAAREALTPYIGNGVPFATFYPAVLLAGLLLPTAQAWALWFVTGLVAHYLFVLPRFGLGLNSEVLIGLLVYYSSSALVVLTAATLRTAVTRLRIAKEREELLNGELLHRIKNVFALIQAVAFQAARKPDTTPDRIRAEIEGWLSAMSETAGLLASHEWQSCDLEQLSNAVLSPFLTKGQITIDGCACEIAADGAEPFALCLHELATNSVKYGALSSPKGRVRLSWAPPAASAKSCSIQWQEMGGPPVSPPSRKGFGSKVMRARRGLLSVKTHYEPGGLDCEMEVRVIDCR